MSADNYQMSRTIITTHDGTFHLDEILAICIRWICDGTEEPPEIIRTRKATEFQGMVVDVGGVYDHHKNRFDHHQPSFVTTFPERFIKLSSAGLVYLHYGIPLIYSVAMLGDYTFTEEEIQEMWFFMYDEYIAPVDLRDNGFMVLEEGRMIQQKATAVSVNDLASIVARCNMSKRPTYTAVWDGFRTALHLVYDDLFAYTYQLVTKFAEKKYILSMLLQRSEPHILLLDRFIASFDAIVDYNDSVLPEHRVLYVITPSEKSEWYSKGVPIRKGSFEIMKSFPQEWRGLRDEALDEMMGIQGGIFCHANGFLLITRSMESILVSTQKAVLI